jgi:precorrin-2 dehydrogenase/sirohydrochlorin ferrochelatase
MLPVTVDVARVRIVLVGSGEAARRRLALLDGAGAARLTVFADAPAPELAEAAGHRLRRRLPRADEIAGAQLVFLSAVGEPTVSRIRRIANAAGVLLNVEDDRAKSDFHSAAVIRRGDLTVAISTGGRSPGLAAAIRGQIESCLGPEWAIQVERIAALRARWRAAGKEAAAIARLTTMWLDREGLIDLNAK